MPDGSGSGGRARAVLETQPIASSADSSRRPTPASPREPMAPFRSSLGRPRCGPRLRRDLPDVRCRPRPSAQRLVGAEDTIEQILTTAAWAVPQPSVLDRRPDPDDRRVRDAADVGAIGVGDAAAGAHHVLEVRLQREAGYHLVLVGRLEQQLVRADRIGHPEGGRLLSVRALRRGRDPRVGEGQARRVVGPPRHDALPGDAGIGVERDQVAVPRRARQAREQAHGAVLRTRHAIRHLVDQPVDPVVAVPPSGAGSEREARRRGDGGGKGSEVLPHAELGQAGQDLAVLVAIAVGDLVDEEGRVRDAEVRAVAVELLRVDRRIPSSRGVAVEDRALQRPVAVGRQLEQHPRRRQRIGGSAARQVVGRDVGPAEGRVDEQVGVLADDERGVGTDLPGRQRHLAVEQGLLVPDLVEAGRGERFDAAGERQAEQVGAAQPVAEDPVAVGVQHGAVEGGCLGEIDVDLQVEPAVADDALPDAAGRVAQRFADEDEAVGDPALRQRGPQAAGIAVEAERGLDRRVALVGRTLGGGLVGGLRRAAEVGLTAGAGRGACRRRGEPGSLRGGSAGEGQAQAVQRGRHGQRGLEGTHRGSDQGNETVDASGRHTAPACHLYGGPS